MEYNATIVRNQKVDWNVMVHQLLEGLSEMVTKKVMENLSNTKLIENNPVPIEQEKDELLTIDEVCKMLKIQRTTLYNWRNSGLLIPDSNIGRLIRYKTSTVQNFIDNRQ